jgi:hypothetical protein
MKKSILLFVLICIVLLVLGITAFYVYQLVVPYDETNILIDYRYMRNNVIRFNHNEVFEKNCETGMSYVFWCNIENWKYKYGMLQPILTKGERTKRSGNIDMLQTNNSTPAIFLGNNSMNETSSDPNKMGEDPTMFFTFDSKTDYNEAYELTNIPLNKWFHIAVSIHPQDAEIYMDGVLLKTIHFENELDFNKRKLNIGELGGFDGYISKLAAFPYAISATEVYKRFLSGYLIEEIEKDECAVEDDQNEEGSSPNNNDMWDNIPYVLTNNNVSSDEIVLDGTDVVTVYSQPNFAGSAVTLSVGNYSINDLADLGIKPKTISGVQFNKEGFLLTLYSENEPDPTDRKVDYLTLRDTSDWDGPLRRMNNKARSLKIEPDPNKDNLKVTLYKNTNYNGWMIQLPVGKYTQTDLKMYGFDSEFDFKSYTIDSDYQMRTYSEDFFVNDKNMLRDDNRNTDGLIGNISSLKIEPRSEDEVVACTFYEEKNYTGNSFKLSYGEHNMSELIKKGVSYDNVNGMFLLRSVVIPSGYNILLYPNDEFQGIPQRLETSTSYIQGKLLHLSIIKSIKIVGANEPKFSLRKLLYKLESMIMGYDNE